MAAGRGTLTDNRRKRCESLTAPEAVWDPYSDFRIRPERDYWLFKGNCVLRLPLKLQDPVE